MKLEELSFVSSEYDETFWNFTAKNSGFQLLFMYKICSFYKKTP